MPDLNDAEKRLVVKTAKGVREAITKRAEDLQRPLAEYDTAVKGDDPEALFSASIMLVLFSSNLIDPVAQVIKQFAEMRELISDVNE